MSAEAFSLLDGAAALLRGMAPDLPGETRYAALLSASAVATARRDLALAGRIAEARAAVGASAAAIRAGAHDGDGALYARLVALSELRAWVTDPKGAPEPARAPEPEAVG